MLGTVRDQKHELSPEDGEKLLEEEVSVSSFHFQFPFHFRFLLFHMPIIEAVVLVQ